MMNTTQLKSFNSSGIEAFCKFLQSQRENAEGPTRDELLEDGSLIEETGFGIDIENRTFRTRRDAANYFHDRFRSISAEQLRRDAGLWSWLSLYYFDQVCPVADGCRRIRNDYTYVYMPNQSIYYYRHLLFIAWYVRFVTPKHNRLFLDTSLHRLDKFTTEVMKRLYLTRIPCVFEVLDRLYWDTSEDGPRKGVITPNRMVAGDLMHRFPTRIRQLEKTYDLLSLTADQLIELLGKEFSRFDRLSTATPMVV
ncbi:hypothetical protein FYK55_12295 [Roseiconus nitratireducens]|uniref:Uncharacterized protein n=1 Tax=Roseiconus nitratireducens TaxID=2605748 RepID=A0A5M6D6B2_9BACT|nr:hypothetical protein [Roseiconus nitratireducens]KAA5543064.1 hypothetical protein FYK55_12295 [Roseiconus nitratireducens]